MFFWALILLQLSPSCSFCSLHREPLPSLCRVCVTFLLSALFDILLELHCCINLLTLWIAALSPSARASSSLCSCTEWTVCVQVSAPHTSSSFSSPLQRESVQWAGGAGRGRARRRHRDPDQRRGYAWPLTFTQSPPQSHPSISWWRSVATATAAMETSHIPSLPPSSLHTLSLCVSL